MVHWLQFHERQHNGLNMKIGLFYGSSTCYTEMAAEKIREILGEDLVDLHNLKDVSPL